jgi:NRAMP (natural resistance-associated macrophage protein)-like metal ion transporter
MDVASHFRRFSTRLKIIGPGFITASLVLGPGSITTASKVGATYGYQMIWLVLLAISFMLLYTTISARIGVVSQKSLLTLVAETYGKPVSILIGVSCFIITAAFEFGNNLGVATAMSSITHTAENWWPPIFTGIALLGLFGAKNLYRLLEKIMLGLVILMLVAFFANLFFAKPDLLAAAKGLVPQIPAGSFTHGSALVATTFSIAACFYQSYLVQEKGWTLQSYKTGLTDAISGILVLGLISLTILLTSAAALHPRAIQITTAGDLALQLEILFGPAAKIIFGLGLWAASFSSFIINAVLGGNLLADSLGLGRGLANRFTKIFATSILLIGMVVALFFRGNMVQTLILAQAFTLVAVPACVIALFAISNNKQIMGKYRNNLFQNIWAAFGMFLLLGLSLRTLIKLISF